MTKKFYDFLSRNGFPVPYIHKCTSRYEFLKYTHIFMKNDIKFTVKTKRTYNKGAWIIKTEPIVQRVITAIIDNTIEQSEPEDLAK